MARTIKHVMTVAAALAALSVLAGCGKPGESTSRAARQPSWDAAADPFVVQGWTSGDKASWLAEVNKRAQNQNEYLRIR
jgi:hypothetical protein